MTAEFQSPGILIVPWFLGLVLSFAVLVLGRRLRVMSHWVSLAYLVVLLFVSVRLGLVLSDLPGKNAVLAVVRNWIHVVAVGAPVSVGLLVDASAVALTTCFAVAGVLVVLLHGLNAEQESPHRLASAVLVGVVGASISWFANSVWLGFGGLALTIIGGFFGLGGRWNVNEGAAAAIRFIQERVTGLAMAIVGAGCLAGFSVPLTWVHEAEPVAVTSMTGTGAILLLVGLLLNLPSFPVLGWLGLPTQRPLLPRVLLVHVLPTVSAFSILFRLEASFRGAPMFDGLALLAAVGGVFTASSGLLQTRWEQALGYWGATLSAVTVAALFLFGPSAALTLLMAGMSGMLVIAAFDGTTGASPLPRGITFFLGLIYSGSVGSAALSGFYRLIGAASQAGAGVTAFVVLLVFLFQLLVWKVLWEQSREARAKARPNGGKPWTRTLAVLLFGVPALGLFWTGLLTGGVFTDSLDRLFPALLERLYPEERALEGGAQQAAALYFWVVTVFSGFFGYWFSGRAQADAWSRVRSALPRLSDFVVHGYSFDTVLRQATAAVAWLGRWLSSVFEEGVWLKAIPRLAHAFSAGLAPRIARGDIRLTLLLSRGLGFVIEMPAKGMQRVQSGDIQWYLFFAVGFGIIFVLLF